MRVVVALNRPTGSLGRPRATGCASLADCGNEIVLLHRINKRSTRFVAIWAPSESRGTVIVAFNPVREVKTVLRKMRNIHARKLVPSRSDENPFFRVSQCAKL
jgi:hypothetical protein